MKIKINPYSQDSVNEALKKIIQYKQSFEYKVQELISELAKMGERKVDTQFSLITEYEPYDVYCEMEGNNAIIIAEGENVIFLEFGTGVDVTDTTDEMETEGLPPIYKGSWSETEGTGQFAHYRYWYYNGHRYTGTMATQGFYLASKEIRTEAVNVAKRIFKK